MAHPDLFVVPSGYEIETPSEAPRVGLRRFDAGGRVGPGGRIERRVFLVQPEPAGDSN
jgi:hypothetical protein